MANILGKNFKIISFGESHGKCVGVVIEGCPAGLKLDLNKIQAELDKRKPGQSVLTTQRKEKDQVKVLSGIFNGITTGASICLVVFNQDVDSSKYEIIKKLPRPGHSDMAAFFKYQGLNDWRGGGIFSGRLTISYVLAGAVAKQILDKSNIEVLAYTVQIGKIKTGELKAVDIKENKEKNLVRCADLAVAKEMEELVLRTKEQGNSVGGVIECLALNVPAGWGEPNCNSLESELSKAIFSIPAIKGIEFGAGFKMAELKGSENNDEFSMKEGEVITKTNNCGGILGGISNGMPIVFRVVVKPTPSISLPQQTINLETKTEETINIEGRHDPCIVPRAVPVVESITAVVLADLGMRGGFIPKILK